MKQENKDKAKITKEQNIRRVAQVIGRGAELIRKRGWCIGALRDDSGRLCLMGAIEEAAKHESRTIRFRAYDEVNKVLRRQGRGIHEWNDEQTSGDRVADLLEGVAKKVHSSYKIELICIHAELLCSQCGQAPGCIASNGFGDFMCRTSPWNNYGHLYTCPDLPEIQRQVREARGKQ